MHFDPDQARRRPRRGLGFTFAFAVGLASAIAGLALFQGCNAGVHDSASGGSGGAGSEATSGKTGSGGNAAQGSTVSSGAFMATSSSGADMDVPMNPCGTQCGPTELCDGVHKGIDDNCDGVVDEGCPCSAGQAEPCFKGDPSYLNAPGCFPGTQQCTENGTWGPCEGGNHATENCFANQQGCHPISSLPFANVDLTTGIGNFGSGGGSYMLDCPGNVMPCPVPDATGHVQVIVSGEYTVTYTDSNGMTCQYPLYVGAKGLRVELSWNYPVSGGTTDLDLHMHEPGTTTPWSIEGATEDCGYGNCKVEDDSPPFSNPGLAPNWFPTTQAMPGDPVSWFLDPVMTNNTCYYAPRNEGQAWIDNGQGCHNPRLDIDDISCDPSITDVTNYDFCAPENINIDFPPQNQWIRVGVNYYPYTSSYAGAIHPDVKIYCDGALVGELGQHGFYSPEAPITWDSSNYSYFWPVADVMFKKDQCTSTCIVQPIYADPAAKTPLFEPNQTPGSSPPFGPAYPPNP